MATPKKQPTGRRVAIVAGLRTPFIKAGTSFKDLTALELGKLCTSELLERAGVKPSEVEQVVFGQVIPSVSAPNIAREIVLATGMPKTIDAYSVSRACATSIQALTDAANSIATGAIDVAIAGGAECMSDIPILYSRNVANVLVAAQKAKSLAKKLRAFAALHARDLIPVPPALAEPSTGLTMGESAEKMAKENHISRAAQDELALRSHQLAAAAWAAGKYDAEVMHVHVPPRYQETVSRDGIVRPDMTMEQAAALRPVFDRKYGTITAANSSPLTDGAAALLLMSEERARALGLKPAGYLRAYGYAAVDPSWQLLAAPPIAAARALDRAGMKLADMDLFEMHEAFAAQVLSNLQAMASPSFARERMGRAEPLGQVPVDRLNVNGGSISLGHPFAATGARMVTTALGELSRRGAGTALLTLCAAGGLGAAVVLERN
jgi:acetyl-CoA acyltransferase